MKSNKKSKGFIIVVVSFVILFLLIGFVCISKLTGNNDNSFSASEFYSVSNLVKNQYITEITNISMSVADKPAIKIENGNVLVADNLNKDNPSFVKAKGIEGTPKYVYANNYHTFTVTIFVCLTEEGDVYYSNTNSTSDSSAVVRDFVKINSVKMKAIYEFATLSVSNINYPSAPLTIYSLGEDNKLYKVSTDNLIEGSSSFTKSTFREDFPYPDMIPGGACADDACNGLYISPDRKLFVEKSEGDNYKYEEVKINKKSLNVKDAFSSIKFTDGNMNVIKNILFYVIDKDNSIYVIEENSDFEVVSSKTYKKYKVKSYKYDKDTFTLNVTYDNGKTEDIGVDNVSTLYDRYNK